MVLECQMFASRLALFTSSNWTRSFYHFFLPHSKQFLSQHRLSQTCLFSGQWTSAKNVWRFSQGLMLFKWYLCWYHQEYNKGSSIRATGQHDPSPSRHLWLLPWGLRIPDFTINCPFVCLKLFLPCCLKSGCLTSPQVASPTMKGKHCLLTSFVKGAGMMQGLCTQHVHLLCQSHSRF